MGDLFGSLFNKLLTFLLLLLFCSGFRHQRVTAESVDAQKAVKNLGFLHVTVTRFGCNDLEKSDNNSFTIHCNCANNVCLVAKIIIRNLRLEGIICDTDVSKFPFLERVVLKNCSILGEVPSISKLAHMTSWYRMNVAVMRNTSLTLIKAKSQDSNNTLLYIPEGLRRHLMPATALNPDFKMRRGLSAKEIVGILIACILSSFLLLALMLRMGWLGDRELRVTYVNLRGKPFTLKQVKDATRNFSPRNEVGSGRRGIVYKAELADQVVAVKKLYLQSKQMTDLIATEVYAQKLLKHENLVELLDCYSNKDLHLLIYEYMEKGSLKQALCDCSRVGLDWERRISICLGLARALKYLHEDSSKPKIIHRNIKASNVLLDGNLNAKLSDLGLAKILDEEYPYNFVEEIPTLSYVAPEYATRRDITDKVDVYSYGVIMLEIVSGKSSASYEKDQETVYLLDMACLLHAKGKLLDLVDKNLYFYDRQQAIIMLNLAIRCLHQSPSLRPTMSEVVSVLEGYKTIEQSPPVRPTTSEIARVNEGYKKLQQSPTERPPKSGVASVVEGYKTIQQSSKVVNSVGENVEKNMKKNLNYNK